MYYGLYLQITVSANSLHQSCSNLSLCMIVFNILYQIHLLLQPVTAHLARMMGYAGTLEMDTYVNAYLLRSLEKTARQVLIMEDLVITAIRLMHIAILREPGV